MDRIMVAIVRTGDKKAVPLLKLPITTPFEDLCEAMYDIVENYKGEREGYDTDDIDA